MDRQDLIERMAYAEWNRNKAIDELKEDSNCYHNPNKTA